MFVLIVIGFNALAGIFAFWTQNAKRQNSKHHLCFNALAGIFAFWTEVYVLDHNEASRFQCPCGHFCFLDIQTAHLECGVAVGFNALAGIFAFWTQRGHHGNA